MKLISWNVNGIRAIAKKGVLEELLAQQPDVICFQETKANPDQITFAPDGYHCYWSSASCAGYSGTGLLSKTEPLSIDKVDLDGLTEGRIIAAEFSKLFLVTTYVPNSGAGLRRLPYRAGWDLQLQQYLATLQRTKPVVLCGDLNVAHTELDLARPAQNRNKTAGFTDQERASFSALLANNNLIDSFRKFHKGGAHYTYWSYRTGGRARGIGWRLDYFCVDQKLRENCTDSFILKDIQGSDHCPVGIVLEGL